MNTAVTPVNAMRRFGPEDIIISQNQPTSQSPSGALTKSPPEDESSQAEINTLIPAPIPAASLALRERCSFTGRRFKCQRRIQALAHGGKLTANLWISTTDSDEGCTRRSFTGPHHV